MRPEHRIPTHPGVILVEEFLKPLGMTQVTFSRHLDIPLQRLNEVCRGRRGVSPETAWLLSQSLGTTPGFWMNLQSNYDLARSRPKHEVRPIRRKGIPRPHVLAGSRA